MILHWYWELLSMCWYLQLYLLHWCEAALCWRRAFFSWGIVGFCAPLHLFLWLTVHHSERSGTVNCTLMQHISVPSVTWQCWGMILSYLQRCLPPICPFSFAFFDFASVCRARWTSWSRRRTWLWWWGAAAGESSLLVLSLSVQVSRGVLKCLICSSPCDQTCGRLSLRPDLVHQMLPTSLTELFLLSMLL